MVIILNQNKAFVSIRWKLLSTYLILIVISLIFTAAFIGETIKANNISVKKDHLINQSNILAESILVSNAEKSINHLVKITSEKINSRILILDKNGVVTNDSSNHSKGKQLLFQEVEGALVGKEIATHRLLEDKGHTLYVAVPIIVQDNVEGVVFISSSLEEIYIQTEDVLKRYLVFSLMIILVTALISLIFAHYMANPIEKLTYSINKIYHGNMEQKVLIAGNDELSNLGKAFNLMSTKLSQVDKQRKEFVASVSHELRTPLSAMKILSESLLHQEDVKPELYREFLKDIDSEVDRLNNIIEDLLSLVDMDQEKLQLNYEVVSLNKLISGVIHSLKPLAKKNDININLHKSKDVNIDIDKSKIQQALMNIISNGIKYTHKGGKINIWVYSENDFSVIKIVDNGMGIPGESIPFIFDKFYRVDKARSRNTGGTGLGLSITKQIIELHQGRIIVESKVDEGTSFYIKIPKNII